MRSIPPDLEEAFARFTAGPSLLRQALVGLDARALSQRPPNDDWSIRDVVMHLADTEMARGYRLRLIIAEENPPIPAFDEEAWKRRLQYLWRDVEAALALFQQTRFSNAELLSYCGKDAWSRTGQHATDGAITVRDLFERGVEHLDEHVAQIAATRRALGC